MHSNNRRKLAEEIQNREVANITRVKNKVNICPNISQTWGQIKQTILVVCIGNQAYRSNDLVFHYDSNHPSCHYQP